MENPTEKMRLIRLLEDSRQAALDALKDVDYEQVVYPDGGWRVKDVIAHIAAWDQEVAVAMEAHGRGGEYRLANFQLDEHNRRVFLKFQLDPVMHLYNVWEAAAVRLRLAVGRLSDEQVASEMLYPSGRKRGLPAELIAELVEHRRDHVADILKALGKS